MMVEGGASESRESAVAADGGGCAASEVVHAAVAAAMFSHEGCPTDPPPWTFSCDSASDTETATSVATFQAGDSVFSDVSQNDAEEAGGQEDAAVAIEKLVMRSVRQPRNTTPEQHELKS